jgi:hypothetical protein
MPENEKLEAGLIIGLLILTAHKKVGGKAEYEFHQDFLAKTPESDVVSKFKSKFPDSFSKFQGMVKVVYKKKKKDPSSFDAVKKRLLAVTGSISLAIKELNMANIEIWDESNCPPRKGLLELMGD